MTSTNLPFRPVLEQRAVLRPASHHVQRSVHVNLIILILHISIESPGGVVEEDMVEVTQQGGIGGGHVVTVDPL